MHSIGIVLKEIREDKGLHLQEVYNNTKIDLSLLSRIENGKRLPTKEQTIQLANYYQFDQNKLLLNLLGDKVVYEIQEESYGQNALMVAEEIMTYGKPKSLFPELETEKTINLESRRYIGNKTKLTNWIINTILEETQDCNSFLDIFAGTATVSKSAFQHFNKVIINDILFSNHIIYKAFFEIGNWSKPKLLAILDNWNNLNPNEIKENYFSENFGDKFFEKNISLKIGHIRQEIENEKNNLTEKEYNILLATLIYNIDKIANTVGHFDAYIKKPIRNPNIEFKLINPIDFVGIEIYKENANVLAQKISADITYIDPPYNSRQYSRFYHLYENLVKWQKPELFGVALKPEPENMSVYCTVGARKAFDLLIRNINTKYIAVSYNNTYNSKSKSSENKIKLEEIENILKKKGETKVFEKSYFNGNTQYLETLLITKNDN
jgi:adenine-specific DNA-methyltransferase